jgi:hypothetical protein
LTRSHRLNLFSNLVLAKIDSNTEIRLGTNITWFPLRFESALLRFECWDEFLKQNIQNSDCSKWERGSKQPTKRFNSTKKSAQIHKTNPCSICQRLGHSLRVYFVPIKACKSIKTIRSWQKRRSNEDWCDDEPNVWGALFFSWPRPLWRIR